VLLAFGAMAGGFTAAGIANPTFALPSAFEPETGPNRM
jgi:hypothetical protein